MDVDEIYFILVLLQSGGVITKEQRERMMNTVKEVPEGLGLFIAASNILDTIE